MCSNECQGHEAGQCAEVFNWDRSRGGRWINDRPDGGLHVYLYGDSSCAEELTFMDGGKSIIIQPEQDYVIRWPQASAAFARRRFVVSVSQED